MKKTKKIKKTTWENKIGLLKFFIFTFFILIAFSGFVYYEAKKGKKLKTEITAIQKEKMENSIRIFKALGGGNPHLYGNENDLEQVKTSSGVSFAKIYGAKELFMVPGNIKKNVEETNKIVLSKDGKGGWYYNQENGVIEPNLP